MFFLTLDHARSFANTLPPPPHPFADGSSDVSVRRQEVSSRSRCVDQNVTVGAVQVQARAKKTARPSVHSVMPNAPERKRPRQSAGKYRERKRKLPLLLL